MNQAKAAQCKDIRSCVELVSKMTGDKYILDKDVKGEVDVSKNFEVNEKNAELFLSEALYLSGYTRVPFDDKTWTIINSRDVRYHPMKNYIYGKDEIPQNYDHVSVVIKLKNPHIASEISRNFRPFMSRYGRIIDIKKPGIIIIADTAKNAHRLIDMVNLIDKEPTKEEIAAHKEEVRFNRRMRELNAKNCPAPTKQ